MRRAFLTGYVLDPLSPTRKVSRECLRSISVDAACNNDKKCACHQARAVLAAYDIWRTHSPWRLPQRIMLKLRAIASTRALEEFYGRTNNERAHLRRQLRQAAEIFVECRKR